MLNPDEKLHQEDPKSLLSLMNQRKSARRYLDRPVKRSDIEYLISCAGKAPSAINLQPWEYVVVYGGEKERLVRRLLKTHAMKNVSCGPGTSRPLPQQFAERSRKAVKVMKPQVAKVDPDFNHFIEHGSCSFYGAPVAVIVCMDTLFPPVRYLDVGLSVSCLLLAAEEKGLSTCPIGLITEYGEEIKESLNIDESKQVLLGIALGYADKEAPENNMKPERETVDRILTWYE
jgi:nitroreductase